MFKEESDWNTLLSLPKIRNVIEILIIFITNFTLGENTEMDPQILKLLWQQGAGGNKTKKNKKEKRQQNTIKRENRTSNKKTRHFIKIKKHNKTQRI